MLRLSILLPFLFLAPVTMGQAATENLQSGIAVEKSLAAGQTNSYTINLEKDQFIQLAVEQHGIDVVIRVFLPSGNLLREFDSPTGSEGTDYAEVVSDTAGAYRIEIAPISDTMPAVSGKYILKLVESRKATDEELKFRANQSTRKAKGLALVVEASQSFDQFRLPETRVTMRIKAAQLLWPSDDEKARAQIALAIDAVKQSLVEHADDDDVGHYQSMMGMRQQVLNALTPHDPEAALKFLQSTRIASTANDDQEVQLESSLINMVLDKDPKRAFELAEAMLQRTSSQTLVQTLNELAEKDRDLARRLARDIAKKVSRQDLLKAPQSAFLSSGLLQMARKPFAPVRNGEQPERLLSEDEYRELFLKIVAEMMTFTSSEDNGYAPENGTARNLAAVVGQMPDDIKTYAPDRAESINKKIAELGGVVTTVMAGWQKYQTAAMSEPIDTALESVEQAPENMRENLYQEVINRVATNDPSRARQLVSERITDPSQRKQILHTIQQQAITAAAQQGRIDEALRLLAKVPLAERPSFINQIIEQIGPGVKKSEAIQYLEQARALISTSVRAHDSEEMQTLLAISRVYSRYDAHRGFQTVEPIIDQFNEICAAAVVMNGFGGEYYVEGEMTIARDNTVSDLANEISKSLATLAMNDFDRAKRDADGIARFDARVRALLTIASNALEIQLDEEVTNGRREDY